MPDHHRARRGLPVLAACLSAWVAFTATAEEVDDSAVETVTVTAQKREEDAQKVPVALTAVSGETIDDRGLETLRELGNQVPNLQIADHGSVRTIFIRGVGGGGRQAGFDTRAGVYVDGVYVGVPAAADSLLLDLARAEVLRGPQGYLFGQNSTSGAISLVTNAPGSGAPSRKLASVGNRDAWRIAAAGDVPLMESGDPRVQLRASVGLSRRDGFTENVLTGQDIDDLDQAGGRLRLRLLPSDAWTIDLSADSSLQRTHNVGGEPRSNTFGNAPAGQPAPFRVDNNTPERDDNRNAGVSATVRHEGAGYGVTSISAWRDATRQWTADFDRSALDCCRFDYDDRTDFYSQELRIDSGAPDTRLRWLAGLYLLGTDSDSRRTVTVLPGTPALPPPLRLLVPGDVQLTHPVIESRSYAAFGSVEWALTERVGLDAGLRVTYTDKRLDFEQQAYSLARFGAVNIAGHHDRLDETAVDPTLGLRYAVSDVAMAYLRYSRGSKSGGFNVDIVSAPRSAPERFDQETVNSVEFGLKSDLLGRRLRANLALFAADYRDYQVNQSVQRGNLIIPSMTNAGRVLTYGPELSLVARPLAGLQWDFDAAWLHATYKEFEDGGGIGVDYSDNRTEFAPRWTVSSALRYERATPWTGPARAYAGLAGHWQIGLFADNLLDKRYDETFSVSTFGTLSGRYGTPRTYGLELRHDL